MIDYEFLEKIKQFHRDKHTLCFRELQYQAQTLVQKAVTRGILIRPDKCEHCGLIRPSGKSIAGHHYNYFEPLSVQWLCCICHRKAHSIDWRHKKTQIVCPKLNCNFPSPIPEGIEDFALYFVNYSRFGA